MEGYYLRGRLAADLVRAHADALGYLRSGGRSATLNCGYGHGFSVLEVIDTVERVSGIDFPVDLAGPRPGDPAWIVARSDRARELLGWKPQFDDLETIVSRALGWERKLGTLQNEGQTRHAGAGGLSRRRNTNLR